MTDTYIYGGLRSPFGRFGGALRTFNPASLAASILSEVTTQFAVEPSDVEEVVLGNAVSPDKIVAREAVLRAGFPDTTVSSTIDRACCSAMTAISELDNKIRAGVIRTGVAGGVEVMSSTPYLAPNVRWGNRLGDSQLIDPLMLADPMSGNPAAVDAAEVAVEHGIGRRDQDEWAANSQQRYKEALERGFFDDEIVSVETPDGAVKRDEQPRPSTTLEALAGLSTVFGSTTVTPGNAPGMNDGAVAVLVGAEGAFGLQPLARVVATTAVAGPSREIAKIPATAISSVLQRSRWAIDDVDLFEVNEAFAAVPLTTMAVLCPDPNEARRLLDRTNVNGGAVAVGHPVGATGSRLVLTLARALRERGLRRGVAAICGGAGQGDAIAIEVCDA